MKRYQSSTPRAAAAIAAVAMTVITFAIAIVVPAMLLPGDEVQRVQATHEVFPAAIDRIGVAANDELRRRG